MPEYKTITIFQSHGIHSNTDKGDFEFIDAF